MKNQFITWKDRVGVVLLHSMLVVSVPAEQNLLLTSQIDTQSVTSSYSKKLNIFEQRYLNQREQTTYKLRGRIKQMPIASLIRFNSREKTRLSRGGKNRHTFQARSGQVVVITLESPQFNSHLALYGSDGRLLIEAKDFDSSTSRIQMRLPSTGVYTIRVCSINSDAEGEYTEVDP
jgi:hypothetical protein